MSLETIRSDFALLDDWEDRYRYVIELGRTLPPMDDALKTDANKVRGCVSQVWLTMDVHYPTDPHVRPRLRFRGDSDAHIVRGLIAILFAIYQDRTPEEILATDARPLFAELGLKEHLTPQRSNGFAAMVERIKSDARAVSSTGSPRRH
jgi:cysteine desulfuration protein SufE